MTDTEAEEMLKLLSTHYKQPVLPMKRFCAAITDWFRCVGEACQEIPEAERKHSHQQGIDYFTHLRHIQMDITKSGLLFRLLYKGEKVRTVKCPTHKGKMNTPMWVGFPGETCVCQGTGWLPNEEKIPYTSG